MCGPITEPWKHIRIIKGIESIRPQKDKELCKRFGRSDSSSSLERYSTRKPQYFLNFGEPRIMQA